MKFSGKLGFMIILKVTKNQHSKFSLEDTFLEKTLKGGQIDPSPSLLRVKTFPGQQICHTINAKKLRINVSL